MSAVTKKLDEEVEAWRCRSLAGRRYRYLIVDAHCERVRREGRVLSTPVLWVVGIDQEGFREHLGVWTGSAESLESWGAVFRDLVDRGVAGVEMVVSDEHLGLVPDRSDHAGEGGHGRGHGVELPPAVVGHDDPVHPRVDRSASVVGVEHALDHELRRPVLAHPRDVVPRDAGVELHVHPPAEGRRGVRVRHRLLQVAEGVRPSAQGHVTDPAGVRGEVERSAYLRPPSRRAGRG